MGGRGSERARRAAAGEGAGRTVEAERARSNADGAREAREAQREPRRARIADCCA